MKITEQKFVQMIDFLESTTENQWCKFEQTKGFLPINIGKQHCFYGHLACNPKSPFFSSSGRLYRQGTATCNEIVSDINNACDPSVVSINNSAPENKIKETVISHLKANKHSIVAQEKEEVQI